MELKTFKYAVEYHQMFRGTVEAETLEEAKEMAEEAAWEDAKLNLSPYSVDVEEVAK